MNRRATPSKMTAQNEGPGWTLMLLVACLTVTGSSSFSFGYGIGAPNMYIQFTEPFLRKQYGICQVDNSALRILHNCSTGNASDHMSTHGQFDFQKEIINGLPQSIFIIGCFIGSLTGSMWGSFSPWCTRRNVFLINYSVVYAAALLVLLSQYLRVGALFYLSRLLHGYQSGMGCAIVPPYVNELSPQRVRGSAGALHQFFITVGILCGQVLGLSEILGRYQYWAVGLSLMAAPCIVASVVLFWIPQSPAEMLIKQNRRDEATKSLCKLRGRSNVNRELEALDIEMQTAVGVDGTVKKRQSCVSLSDLFTRGDLRWQTLTSLTLLTVQALSGINAVFFYSGKIFRTAGIAEQYLQYANVVTGLINVAITIVAIYLIERLGRRPLIIYPMLAMTVLFALLTACIQLNEKTNSLAIGIVSVLLVMLFICSFALGLGPIAFLYPSEVFRLEARDIALQVGLCLNYTGNLFLSLFFPAINTALRGFVFLLFMVIVSFSLGLLWWKMPETRNKSIDEIERYWYGHPKRATSTPAVRDHANQTLLNDKIK